MSSERWSRIDALFHDALELAPEQRAAFLERACDGDAELRADVEELLSADMGSTNFLRPPSDATLAGLAQVSLAASARGYVGERIGAYTVVDEIASGGMGTVYRAVRDDRGAEETVAIKVIRQGAWSEQVLARFDQERQTLARLIHSHIARLLGGGVTDDGLPYLVIEHVDGVPIDTYCDENRLPVSERLALFRTVCAAVHHAHQNLIVHRDLKPTNILVDGGGAPKLLDFGIAKVLEPEASVAPLTGTGMRPMTPEYASPEQVRGEAVTTVSDVYSLGVLLYQLLTGHRPYRLETRLTHEIERVVCEQDPQRPSTAIGRTERRSDDGDGEERREAGITPEEVCRVRGMPFGRLRRALSGDLDMITLMALRKEPERRYASVEQLAEDIRRHQEGLPVVAQRDTWRYRSGKFVRRHKTAVAAAAVTLLALAAGGTASLYSARVVEARLAEVLRLSDLTRLDDYEAEAETLWPALPERATAMRDWLERAHELALHLGTHRDTLERMRARALPYDDATRRENRERHPLAAELDDLTVRLPARTRVLEAETSPTRREQLEAELIGLEERIAALEQEVETRHTWYFDGEGEQWQHDKLSELVERLDAFTSAGGTLADVENRLERAEAVRLESLEIHAAAWTEAVASIADREACPLYDGLPLSPQVGLVPIGRDPDSGLWEFAYVPTGTIPARDDDGRLTLTEESALVFVLLPGGTFEMGAERPSAARPPGSPNADPYAEPKEGPVHGVTLDAFFLSKYEMTQAQWLAFTGHNPSLYAPDAFSGVAETTRLHPVEQVSWEECSRTLTRLGLCLPTEAQWEYAARAGTTTPWWTGAERESLVDAVNVADASASRSNAAWSTNRDWQELDDGYDVHAPVDVYRPNPFGLFAVHGNVWEWCSDDYGGYEIAVRDGDGERLTKGGPLRVGRGGSYTEPTLGVRSSSRGFAEPQFRAKAIGVRPARRIE